MYHIEELTVRCVGRPPLGRSERTGVVMFPNQLVGTALNPIVTGNINRPIRAIRCTGKIIELEDLSGFQNLTSLNSEEA
jgi:hypothetical protein